jgi:hypothetical protein
MVCTSCGETVTGSRARFCPRCGASVRQDDLDYTGPQPAAREQPPAAPKRRRDPLVEGFKLLLLLGAFVGVAYYFNRPRQVLTFVAVFTALLVFYNVVFVVVARMMGMRPEVFSVYFGPPVARFRVGAVDYVVGSLPLGSYVKFAVADPLDPAPRPSPPVPGPRFDELHPLQRAFLFVSAPLAVLALGVGMLGPKDSVASTRSAVRVVRAQGPIATTRIFVDKFSTTPAASAPPANSRSAWPSSTSCRSPS